MRARLRSSGPWPSRAGPGQPIPALALGPACGQSITYVNYIVVRNYNVKAWEGSGSVNRWNYNLLKFLKNIGKELWYGVLNFLANIIISLHGFLNDNNKIHLVKSHLTIDLQIVDPKCNQSKISKSEIENRSWPYYIWSAHAKNTGDAKCQIPFLPLNLMPQIFFYIHVSEQGIDS